MTVLSEKDTLKEDSHAFLAEFLLAADQGFRGMDGSDANAVIGSPKVPDDSTGIDYQ